MPRDRDLVMTRLDDQLKSHAILEAAVEKHSPYKRFKQSKDIGFETKGYCIVYTNPRTQERVLSAQDLSKKEADHYLWIMSISWARGYIAAQD